MWESFRKLPLVHSKKTLSRNLLVLITSTSWSLLPETLRPGKIFNRENLYLWNLFIENSCRLTFTLLKLLLKEVHISVSLVRSLPFICHTVRKYFVRAIPSENIVKERNRVNVHVLAIWSEAVLMAENDRHWFYFHTPLLGLLYFCTFILKFHFLLTGEDTECLLLDIGCLLDFISGENEVFPSSAMTVKRTTAFNLRHP